MRRGLLARSKLSSALDVRLPLRRGQLLVLKALEMGTREGLGGSSPSSDSSSNKPRSWLMCAKCLSMSLGVAGKYSSSFPASDPGGEDPSGCPVAPAFST